MTAAPEYWQEQVVQIHDERLEKVLRVDYFGLPGGQDDPHCREGISYTRFPEWYFCPKCRRFQPIHDWVSDYKKSATQKRLNSDPDMVKFMQCPKCRQDLVVTRIITACECGHIDDFPWVKWVHCKNMYGGAKPICAHPALTFKTSASSTEGLEGLTVSCDSCGARATLKGAFDKDALQELDQKYEGRYNFRCSGRHPWKHTKDKCTSYPKVLQRGSSSVYFPITVSSLVIPPYSSLITKKIEDSAAFLNCKNIIAEYKRNVPKDILPTLIQSTIEKYAKDIAIEKGIAVEKVQPILERKWIIPSGEEEYLTTSVRYRAEEYEALSGEVSMSTDDYGDFLREGTEISNYAIPYIKNISLIHKVREVQALVGFSRLKPVEASMGDDSSEYIVPIKQPNTNWYPAYEVRGEGIFIEFDENAILEWQKNNPEIQHRVDVLNENYRKSFIGQSKPRKITAKFLLLHTISHALIKQLSFECGYSIASLKERLYCSEISEGKQMSGIFIYTASGDSEGTMGGLVRQGHSDSFPGIFKKAIAGFACKICNTARPDYKELKSKLEDYYISGSFPYKHVIIDEGQDFGSEAIEETDIIQLIHDIIVDTDQGGTFYVFYDRLQLIQAREMPKFISDLDCRLTLYRNCRNTENIAVTSLRPITERKPRVFDGAVKGAPAKLHFCESAQSEHERIDVIIDELAADGYRDIVILTCKTESTSVLSNSVKGGRYRNKYLFTTCRKFKGLEADVVVLVDVDKTTFDQDNVLLFYVGTSRARIKLEITAVLSDDDCKDILLSSLNYQGKVRRAKKDLAGALNAVGSLNS